MPFSRTDGSTKPVVQFFSFWLNINAFQSPLVQQQDPHDMSALQPWLKFNAMAYHKIEKLTYQILFYFSSCISSSFPPLFFLVRQFTLLLQLFFRFISFSSVHFCVLLLRWGRWMIVGLRVRVFRWGESISQSATSSPDLFDEKELDLGRKVNK